MAKKIENMTIEELEAAIQDRMNKRRELKAEQQEFQARIVQLQAQAKVDTLTDSEKAALAQAIAANGIETGEKVNGLG